MQAKTQPFFAEVKRLTGLSEKRFRELQREIIAVRDRLLQEAEAAAEQ